MAGYQGEPILILAHMRPMGGYSLSWYCCPVTVSFCTLLLMKKGSSRFGPALCSQRAAEHEISRMSQYHTTQNESIPCYAE